MPEKSIDAVQPFVRKIGVEIADEIAKRVKAATYKLKTSNDQLRKNVEAAQVKAEGAKKELDTQVARARNAESKIEHLSKEREKVEVELAAVRQVLERAETEKREAEFRAAKAENALKKLKEQEG